MPGFGETSGKALEMDRLGTLHWEPQILQSLGICSCLLHFQSYPHSSRCLLLPCSAPAGIWCMPIVGIQKEVQEGFEWGPMGFAYCALPEEVLKTDMRGQGWGWPPCSVVTHISHLGEQQGVLATWQWGEQGAALNNLPHYGQPKITPPGFPQTPQWWMNLSSTEKNKVSPSHTKSKRMSEAKSHAYKQGSVQACLEMGS